MSNLSFRAAELGLHFDASGSVSMQYDLKLWLWRGPRPEFHTVGTFDGRLSLNRAQMSWHTPDNRVRAAWEPQGVRVAPGHRAGPELATLAGTRVPVLPAVPRGSGAPGQGLPLLLL